MENFSEKVNFIWSVADLLRGDYKQSEYGRVILPLTVLRRLDCVLEPTKPKVRKRVAELEDDLDRSKMGPILQRITKQRVFNTSPFTFQLLLDEPNQIAKNLRAFIAGFDDATRDVLERFRFDPQIRRLDKANLLYKVVGRFCDFDLHPDNVENTEMGLVYEELVRKFSEMSNETAGEHFTPREVIRLMVNLLFVEDEERLVKRGVTMSLYDPACGTGGMLSVAENWLRDSNPNAKLKVFGQELNDETFAICWSDMVLKGQDASNIYAGNSFTQDGVGKQRFDYMLANPPFGVEWKKYADEVKAEHADLGLRGRFGAGLPRINDGSLLFLQHMLSKMKDPAEGGTRLAIVFNGSPLFTGGAGSGESNIRRWIIEHDWLEAVVALPEQLFYNTGIATYFWVLTNRKSRKRRGKVQLVDARASWAKMRKSLGEKRRYIPDDAIVDITKLYNAFKEDDRSKIFANSDFGYRRIRVERPLRLRWEVSDDTLALLAEEKAVAKLEDDVRSSVVSAIGALRGESTTDEDVFVKQIREALDPLDVKKPIEKAVLSACAVRDPDAPIVTDKKGNPQPDTDLRDHENVPLHEDVDEYMKREVLPFVPDAWVDESAEKIGYEIPLTRHFYKYVPPRPLEEIDAEIKALEAEIQDLLDEVTE